MTLTTSKTKKFCTFKQIRPAWNNYCMAAHFNLDQIIEDLKNSYRADYTKSGVRFSNEDYMLAFVLKWHH